MITDATRNIFNLNANLYSCIVSFFSEKFEHWRLLWISILQLNIHLNLKEESVEAKFKWNHIIYEGLQVCRKPFKIWSSNGKLIKNKRLATTQQSNLKELLYIHISFKKWSNNKRERERNIQRNTWFKSNDITPWV